MPPDTTYPTRVQITAKGTLYARKITLRHIKTGRVVSAPSVTAFARQMRWGPNGGQHFDNVLKGHRLHHRGWGMRSVLNKKLALKDVFGNRYKATIAEIVARLGAPSANRLRRYGAVGKLVLDSHDFTHVLTPKTYRVESYVFRAGDDRGRGNPLVSLTRLAEAPIKLGISMQQAFQLVHGYRPSVRGVTFVRAHTTQRRATEALATVS